MKVFQVTGYSKNQYFVSHEDWKKMYLWLNENNVDFLHECSGSHGVGFTSRKNKAWFILRCHEKVCDFTLLSVMGTVRLGQRKLPKLHHQRCTL